MRYTPDDPAFEGDFIELSDSWSRAQVRAIWDIAGEDEGAFLAALRPKIVALHLTCVDAPPICDVAELTPERTADMDTRLYEWFANAWVTHLVGLANLGNALGGKLLATSVAMQPPANSRPTN